MALSDEIKGIYDQLDAMVFAADALQTALSDPMSYKPYHGSDAKEIVLEMQLSLNSAIKSLQQQADALYSSMAEVASRAKLTKSEG